MVVSARLAALGLAVTLAACGGASLPVSKETKAALAGLEAYRADDASGLATARGELATLNADPVPFPNPCTADDYRQRRLRDFSALLAALDRPGWQTQSDEERFQAMLSVIQLATPGGGQPNTSSCQTTGERHLLAAVDGADRIQVLMKERDMLQALAAKSGHPAPANNP
jgi:hypothetical protein